MNFSAIKYLILIVVLMMTPAIAVKLSRSLKNEDTKKLNTVISDGEIEDVVKKYLDSHSEEILNSLKNHYYKNYQDQSFENKISDAVLFFEKILFNKDRPKILSKVVESPNIGLFFSDFDLVLPILEEINNFPNQLKVNFFFHQIVTQSKFSGVIAAYGCAIFKIKQSLYIPYYLSVLKVPKKDLNLEKIEFIIKNFGLDFEEIRKTSESPEIQKIILSTNDIASRVGIDQLPAFVIDNGKIFFGNYGFEIIKKLMYEK